MLLDTGTEERNPQENGSCLSVVPRALWKRICTQLVQDPTNIVGYESDDDI